MGKNKGWVGDNQLYHFRSVINTPNVSPGPGSYDLRKRSIYEKDKGFALKGKRKDFCNKRPQTPCPGSYDPNYKLVESEKFKGITFGKGKRVDIGHKLRGR